MAREPDPITLSQLVRRAAEIVDPNNEDTVVGEFEQRFEDADEPVTGFENLEERIEFGADEDPSVVVAQAVVLYLAHRRDEVGDDDDDIISLAVRAEFEGNPPQSVLDWMAERGVRA
jgi:DhnA family fructose-bisphosphate aldolase class Ia